LRAQANVATLFVAALEKPNLYLQVRCMLLLHDVSLVLNMRLITGACFTLMML
jgi:hypothetical protein